ncbi:hypothetical protein [Chitinophaga sp. CF418]|uniref:hypothetical protein n=1 Tax=Chitinophaga sp. CF418 TaxID=1855287 RepID=UPI000918F2F6|nr:hypothetical protein [Chitinophaga sp. CF418]SHN45956.1 hypothetical protein SAMN05216311_12248 [Chitinophaga sp. CF418]
MILNAGIPNVIDLLRGDAAGKKVAKLVVGTGNSPVTGTETSLTGQVAKDVLSTNLITGGYVQFNSELTAGDPAMVIQEMGLLNDAGVLIHRRVIAPMNKVAGVTYSINYKIRVQ